MSHSWLDGGMEKRPLGTTGLEVPVLGLGAGGLGEAGMAESEVRRLLEIAVEAGVVLVDAAPSYGEAEVRLGRHLRGVDGVLISTKVGYGVEGVPDWTGPTVTAGIDAARRRLQVEVIDIVHLHSCPLDVLQHGGVVEALVRAREAGALRVAAYSGDGPALAWATQSGAFGSVQASLNLCDRANRETLRAFREAGGGVLAKRVLANAAWRGPPTGAEVYHERWKALALDLGGLDPAEVALRYSAFHAPADGLLVGTRNPTRLRGAVDAVRRGPLEPDLVDHLEARWAAVGEGWPAHV